MCSVQGHSSRVKMIKEMRVSRGIARRAEEGGVGAHQISAPHFYAEVCGGGARLDWVVVGVVLALVLVITAARRPLRRAEGGGWHVRLQNQLVGVVLLPPGSGSELGPCTNVSFLRSKT